jgi:hypothetical protein
LTCVPTLAPLFTYFSEKTSNSKNSNRRNYYDDGHELHSHGEGSRVNRISNFKPAQDSADSDSQKFILDPESSIDGNGGSQRTYITKTVEVEVEYLDSLPDGSGAKKS